MHRNYFHKQPGLVSNFIYIVVDDSQRALLWWKVAAARSFILNTAMVT